MRILRARDRAMGRDREPIDPDLPSAQGLAARGPFGIVNLAFVGIGGALGTFARYCCSITWSNASGQFPTTILVVNVTGAFLIGLVLTGLVRVGRTGGPRLFTCVGVLGGWTTMSTAAVKADLLIAHHHALAGIVYLLASLVGGAIATACGIAIAHRAVKVASR